MEHIHEAVFKEVVHDGEFSFHPYLASALRKKFSLSINDVLVVYEKTCQTSDCPLVETIVEFTKEKKYRVRFPRKKEHINKLDLSFVKLEELENYTEIH